MARPYASGKITERVWDNLWAEWQDRRRTLKTNLEALQQKHEFHIANLDAALTIIAKVGILYGRLQRSDQKDLLRQMIERVVVNPEGIIIRLELLAPFSYLTRIMFKQAPNGESHRQEARQSVCWDDDSKRQDLPTG